MTESQCVWTKSIIILFKGLNKKQQQKRCHLWGIWIRIKTLWITRPLSSKLLIQSTVIGASVILPMSGDGDIGKHMIPNNKPFIPTDK